MYLKSLTDVYKRQLLTGSTAASERSSILERVASGTLDVVFGTHAVLNDD